MRQTALILIMLVLTELASAQEKKKKENLQQYTPSVLFGRGEWEFKNFNNLYTQTKSFGSGGQKIDNHRRDNYYTMINQFLYGISKQLNVGLDLWVKRVNVIPSDVSGSMFQNSSGSRTALTGLGPKIKVAPFKKMGYFSWQSTFLFPLASDLEGRKPGTDYEGLFLEWDRYLWMNQFFYDRTLNDKFQIFLQLAFWYSIVRESSRENNFPETPMSVFFSYFPTTRITLYVMTEYWPKHHQEPFYAYFVHSGLGAKYQVIPGLMEVELLYTNFWNGSEGEGAGQTFNLGVRFIH